jgi:general secretion pathway protein A
MMLETRMLESFGLHEDPFNRTARLRYPFPSTSYRRALEQLYYHAESGPGILALTADPGAGRTTLLRHIESRIRAHSRTLFFSAECCHLAEAFGFLAAGPATGAKRRGTYGERQGIEAAVPSNGQAPRRRVLFVDDAQELEYPALQALRSLMHLRARGANPLTIVLAGSHEMPERFIDADLRDDFHWLSIAPLAPEEVAGYIAHRLRLAGCITPIFSPDACETIAVQSRGISARINELCSEALRTAAERGLTLIDGSVLIQEDSVGGAPAPAAPAMPAPKLRGGRGTAIAISAFAILSVVLAGVWRKSEQFVPPIGSLGGIAAPQSSSKRITNSPVKVSFQNPRMGNLPSAVIPRRIGASDVTLSPALGTSVPAAAIVPSRAPQASVAAPAPASALASAAAAANRSADSRADSATRAESAKLAAAPVIATAAASGSIPTPQIKDPATTPKPAAPPSAAGTAKPKPAPAAIVTSIVTAGAAKGTVAPPLSREDELRVTPAAAAPGRTPALSIEQASFETRLGDAYMKLGEYDNAIHSFQSALVFTPGDGQLERRIERARRAKTVENNILH